MKNDNEICESCKVAVTETYGAMRRLGADELTAFRSALHVLALRHPGEPRRVRAALLTEWLTEGKAV